MIPWPISTSYQLAPKTVARFNLLRLTAKLTVLTLILLHGALVLLHDTLVRGLP
jgi:hypothetical protein